MALYSVQYIESLEARISNIQSEATLVDPRMSIDQPEDAPSRHLADPQITNEISNPQSTPDQPDMAFMAPLDTSNNMIYSLDMLQSEGNLFSVSDVANYDTTTDSPMSVPILGQGSAPTFAEVSIHEGALFFQAYFETVHPRYPFLDAEECSRGYQDWKTGEIFISGRDAWRSYLVKMACGATSSSFQLRALSNIKKDLRRRLPFTAGKTRLLHTPAASQPDAPSSSRPKHTNGSFV
ncbi:MAG: hypothetical protein CL912_24525 [Deltaproteobacteria bacterium]|nr:hypothetical protein [Deltaproteobacteria bacterium]|tara:strand:+ start:42 stop:752 length:711 start_codon:yes stop_codon:yes gene_type:complete